MQLSKRFAAAVLSASPLPTVAAAGAEDPVLQGLIEQALARNPELAAARQSLAAAQARPAQAGSRPGPTLSVTYQNDGVAPTLGSRDVTMLALGASQQIPYPGKRDLRRQVATAEADAAASDVERARLSLVAAVKRAYYRLRLPRGLAALAEGQGNLWREIQETAHRDELAVTLARKDFKPDLTVEGAYVNRGGLDPMWQAGVSISLPARSRARAALTEAEARLAASKASLEDLRLRLDSVVEQRLALLQAAQQIETTYREGLLTQEQPPSRRDQRWRTSERFTGRESRGRPEWDRPLFVSGCAVACWSWWSSSWPRT